MKKVKFDEDKVIKKNNKKAIRNSRYYRLCGYFQHHICFYTYLINSTYQNARHLWNNNGKSKTSYSY